MSVTDHVITGAFVQIGDTWLYWLNSCILGRWD